MDEPHDEVAAAAAAPADDPVPSAVSAGSAVRDEPAPVHALDEPSQRQAFGADVTPPRPPTGVGAPVTGLQGAPNPLARPAQPVNLTYSAPGETGQAERVRSGGGSADAGPGRARARVQEGNAHQVVGSGPARNAPCPCGSGKKYKKCHGAPGAA
ncbi:MAG TPA: SEC-C domain-containing protein [Mycobacteriales bacterium]